MNIDEKLEESIENKYMKDDKGKNKMELTIEESVYILKRKDFNTYVEDKAIETLLTAYEKEKETSHYIQSQLDIANAKLVEEKEKNKNAYRKANNYLYFNDSADYEVALWEVIRTLRPDLADKWDNGEDALLKYIEEE